MKKTYLIAVVMAALVSVSAFAQDPGTAEAAIPLTDAMSVPIAGVSWPGALLASVYLVVNFLKTYKPTLTVVHQKKETWDKSNE